MEKVHRPDCYIWISESNSLESTYPDQDDKSVVPDSSLSKAVVKAEEPIVATNPKVFLHRPNLYWKNCIQYALENQISPKDLCMVPLSRPKPKLYGVYCV